MSWYILRCPDGNHLGYPYWDKVILNIWNGRTQLHDVLNKQQCLIDQIILKYTNKVILNYLLGIKLVLWYVDVSWDYLLTIYTKKKRTQFFEC